PVARHQRENCQACRGQACWRHPLRFRTRGSTGAPTEAVGVATQLEKIPGTEPGQMHSVIAFWYRLADLARTAALRCVGANQTLAEATITFMFLQKSCPRKPAATETAHPDGTGKVVGQ